MSKSNNTKTQFELEAIANRMSRMAKSLDWMFEATRDQGDHIAGLLLGLSNEACEAADNLNALAGKLVDSEAEQNLDSNYATLAAMLKRRDALQRDLADITVDIEATPAEHAELHAGAEQNRTTPILSSCDYSFA